METSTVKVTEEISKETVIKTTSTKKVITSGSETKSTSSSKSSSSSSNTYIGGNFAYDDNDDDDYEYVNGDIHDYDENNYDYGYKNKDERRQAGARLHNRVSRKAYPKQTNDVEKDDDEWKTDEDGNLYKESTFRKYDISTSRRVYTSSGNDGGVDITRSESSGSSSSRFDENSSHSERKGLYDHETGVDSINYDNEDNLDSDGSLINSDYERRIYTSSGDGDFSRVYKSSEHGDVHSANIDGAFGKGSSGHSEGWKTDKDGNLYRESTVRKYDVSTSRKVYTSDNDGADFTIRSESSGTFDDNFSGHSEGKSLYGHETRTDANNRDYGRKGNDGSSINTEYERTTYTSSGDGNMSRRKQERGRGIDGRTRLHGQNEHETQTYSSSHRGSSLHGDRNSHSISSGSNDDINRYGDNEYYFEERRTFSNNERDGFNDNLSGHLAPGTGDNSETRRYSKNNDRHDSGLRKYDSFDETGYRYPANNTRTVTNSSWTSHRRRVYTSEDGNTDWLDGERRGRKYGNGDINSRDNDGTLQEYSYHKRTYVNSNQQPNGGVDVGSSDRQRFGGGYDKAYHRKNSSAKKVLEDDYATFDRKQENKNYKSKWHSQGGFRDHHSSGRGHHDFVSEDYDLSQGNPEYTSTGSSATYSRAIVDDKTGDTHVYTRRVYSRNPNEKWEEVSSFSPDSQQFEEGQELRRVKREREMIIKPEPITDPQTGNTMQVVKFVSMQISIHLYLVSDVELLKLF